MLQYQTGTNGPKTKYGDFSILEKGKLFKNDIKIMQNNTSVKGKLFKNDIKIMQNNTSVDRL